MGVATTHKVPALGSEALDMRPFYPPETIRRARQLMPNVPAVIGLSLRR